MRKVDLFLSLTFVVVVLCVNYLILSLHWSVTSKVIILTLLDCVYLSVALQVRQVLQAIWSTIRKLAGYWPQSLGKRLVKTPRKLATSTTKTSDYKSFDEWQKLNDKEIANYKNFLEER